MPEQVPSHLDLEMHDNQLFQRFIANRVSKEREFVFSTSSNDYTGFVTGLDSTHLQLTTTDGLRAVLLQRPNIDGIEETGRTLEELDPETQEKVREFSALFFRIVVREMSRNKISSG